MKLWYRCEMCSPNQSKEFDIEATNPSYYAVLSLVELHHKQTSPKCPAAAPAGTVSCVEVLLLVRMVQ
jgi:hypothetical protein